MSLRSRLGKQGCCLGRRAQAGKAETSLAATASTRKSLASLPPALPLARALRASVSSYSMRRRAALRRHRRWTPQLGVAGMSDFVVPPKATQQSSANYGGCVTPMGTFQPRLKLMPTPAGSPCARCARVGKRCPSASRIPVVADDCCVPSGGTTNRSCRPLKLCVHRRCRRKAARRRIEYDDTDALEARAPAAEPAASWRVICASRLWPPTKSRAFRP